MNQLEYANVDENFSLAFLFFDDLLEKNCSVIDKKMIIVTIDDILHLPIVENSENHFYRKTPAVTTSIYILYSFIFYRVRNMMDVVQMSGRAESFCMHS